MQLDQLDSSLIEFEGRVRKLLEPCSLDEAFDAAQEANIASMMEESFYEVDYHDSSRFPLNEAERYIQLIDICLGKFEIMRPGLNGHSLDVELIREQMIGREELVGMLIGYSRPGYN